MDSDIRIDFEFHLLLWIFYLHSFNHFTFFISFYQLGIIFYFFPLCVFFFFLHILLWISLLVYSRLLFHANCLSVYRSICLSTWCLSFLLRPIFLSLPSSAYLLFHPFFLPFALNLSPSFHSLSLFPNRHLYPSSSLYLDVYLFLSLSPLIIFFYLIPPPHLHLISRVGRPLSRSRF